MASTIRELDGIKIPLKNILAATNNFADENIVGEGGLSNVYKGKLYQNWNNRAISFLKRIFFLETDYRAISARRFGRKYEREFLTEISVLSGLKNEHVVELIGFCEEEGEKIIITSYHAKGSLLTHLSDPALTWGQRMKISLGVALAIAYLQAGKEVGSKHLIIHRNINSSTILLDDDYGSKLSGFEYSIKVPKDRKHHIHHCEPMGTRGYMDPAIEKNGGVNYKSDVYCFGVVLFEILCGRKAYQDNEELLAPLAKLHYEQGTLQDIIHPDLWKQMDPKSFKIISELAYSCLESDWTRRPVISQVLDKLTDAINKYHPEGEENLTDVKSAEENLTNVKSMLSEDKKLDRLRIPLAAIEYATDKFANRNIIGKGGPSKVYKGKLRDQNLNYRDISARRFDRNYGLEFLTEMSVLSGLKNEFTVELIGFCEEESEKIIITSYYANGSLLTHLSNPALTWGQRIKISLGVALAIACLQVGKKGSRHLIIHRNINSSTILLDDVYHPKLSGFEYSIKVPLNRKHHVHRCEPMGTRGYMDPAIEKNGGVDHKSDVYSFGVVLFEILCGRKAYQDNELLAPLAKFHYEKGTLQDIIHPDLWKQMDPKSFRVISEVAYSCLESDWTRRPDILPAVQKLTDAKNQYDSKVEENLTDVKSELSNQRKNLENKTARWEERLKMCIDTANELNYLHNEMEVQKTLIHGDTKSGNIELNDNNLGAKIDGYRTSVFHNEYYMDPEFFETGNQLSKESDVFGFGVLMFEMLCGYEASYILKILPQKHQGMADIVRLCHDDKGKIKNFIADVLMEENGDSKFFLQKGPNEDSLNTFIKIVCQCVLEKRNQRPTMEVIIEELHKALTFQKNHKDKFRMSFEDIKLATKNFSRANVIGGGGFGCVYKGELVHRSGEHYTIVAKKLDTRYGQGEIQFYNELQILYEYKHENIIGLVGYSNETDEKIIVYEHAPKGSLDKHLSDASLTWRNRLKVCIDFATGLDFLHGGVDGKHVVIHRDIKSANILLFDDGKAKVGDFGLSMISTLNNRKNDYTIDIPMGTKGYLDPQYSKSGMLTMKSDIYSFGVVLLEILCGKAIYQIHRYESESLLSFVERNFEEGKQDDLVFKAINEEIVQKSLTAFLDILYACLDNDRKKRPSSKEVLAQLKKALELQDDDTNKELYGVSEAKDVT